MDRLNVTKKFLVLSLVIVMLLSMTGCDSLILSLNTSKAKKCVENFIEESDTDFIAALQKYSLEEITPAGMIDEQKELFDTYGICEFEIDSVELDDEENMDTAVCKLNVTYKKFSKVIEDMPEAVLSDYARKLKKLKNSNETFKLKMSFNDGEWMFDDLTDLYETLCMPYEMITILDENGTALNPNAEYYGKKIVSSLWYDPIYSIPLDGNKVTSPVAIQCAFYFNRPVTDTFEARLLDSKGKTISTKEITMDISVICICDFSLEYVGVDKFDASTYKIGLYFNNEEICVIDESLSVQ